MDSIKEYYWEKAEELQRKCHLVYEMMPILYALIKSTKGDITVAFHYIEEGRKLNIAHRGKDIDFKKFVYCSEKSQSPEKISLSNHDDDRSKNLKSPNCSENSKSSEVSVLGTKEQDSNCKIDTTFEGLKKMGDLKHNKEQNNSLYRPIGNIGHPPEFRYDEYFPQSRLSSCHNRDDDPSIGLKSPDSPKSSKSSEVSVLDTKDQDSKSENDETYEGPKRLGDLKYNKEQSNLLYRPAENVGIYPSELRYDGHFPPLTPYLLSHLESFPHFLSLHPYPPDRTSLQYSLQLIQNYSKFYRHPSQNLHQ